MKSKHSKAPAGAEVKDIRRATRKQYSAEEKIRIVLEGLRGEDSIAELCRREGIAQGVYYKWPKDFMEAGKRRLAGDTSRSANTDEVRDLRREARDLKEVVAEQTLEMRLLKKSMIGRGRRRMRYPASEKLEIIRLVEKSHLLAKRTLDRLGVARPTFYRWYDLITSPSFIVMKAASEFKDKTTTPNQLWQTDFTYLKIIGWGWYYLSTILDDYSRYIIAWKLCTTMRAEDVTDTLELALKASGCDQAHVLHKPRLLSDNGPSYVAGELADYLADKNMSHVRGAPFHPQTQGKIKRWHQTLKNRILLENYYLPGDLEAQVEAFVEHYNYQRYHESLKNVTPADAYSGRAEAIIKQRERIKRKTIEHRRLHHRKLAA